MPSDPARIPSLDGLRAVSILLVLALHTLQRFDPGSHASFLWYALCNGAFGVFIFFEISGFLITTLLLREWEKHGSISLRGFFLRRAFRILPPLYLYIAVVVLLGFAGHLSLSRIDVVSSLFFFHNFSAFLHPAGSPAMWSLEHLWSISVEEQFYLVWPLLLVFFLKVFPKWNAPIPTPPATSAAASRATVSAASSTNSPANSVSARFAAASIPLAVLVLSPPLRILLGHSKSPTFHQLGVANINFDFLMFGCLLALLQKTPIFERLYLRATHRPWLAPALLVLCSLLAARFENYFNLTVGYTLEAVCIGVLLLWCTRNPASRVGRFLNWRPIAWIGVLSYSIYLWQTLFLHRDNVSLFGTHNPLGTFPGNWLACLGTAAVSFYVIEQPSLRARGSLLRLLRASRRALPVRTPQPGQGSS